MDHQLTVGRELGPLAECIWGSTTALPPRLIGADELATAGLSLDQSRKFLRAGNRTRFSAKDGFCTGGGCFESLTVTQRELFF